MKILLGILILLIIILVFIGLLFMRLAERVKKLEQGFAEMVRKSSFEKEQR